MDSTEQTSGAPESSDLTVSSTGPVRPQAKSPTLSALYVGLIAGLIGWGVGEAAFDHFKPSKKAAAEAYAFTQLNIERDIADGRNAAVGYGVLGAATALGLGLVGGRAGGSSRRGAIAGLVGLAAAVAAVALLSLAVVPLHRKYYEPTYPDLKLPILIHGAIWCTIGAVGGLAFGAGLGDRRRIAVSLVGGLIGAALATVLFDLIGAAALPFSQADMPIPKTSMGRLLAYLLVAVGTTLGASMAVAERRPRVKSPSPEV